MANEAMKFFAAAKNDKGINAILDKTSTSAQDKANRMAVYEKVFSTGDMVREKLKMFSGYAEIPLLNNQYFNATISSWVRSFAGFLSIERDMNAQTALLYYFDLLGVTDNRIRLQNVGKEDLNGINARFTTSAPFVVGKNSYMITTGKKLIPGSVELKLVHVDDPQNAIIIKDDRKGNLLAPAGVLASGTVDYTSAGRIQFELGANFVAVNGDSYSIIAYEDVAGTPEFNQFAPGNNRFKLDERYVEVTAEPDMLIGESNLMMMASANKSQGVDLQDILGSKLTELYTKLINGKLTHAIIDNYEGTTTDFDMTSDINHFLDFQSRLQSFESRLVDVDTDLAKKSVKGVRATAYLVGLNVGNWFEKCKQLGSFVPNTDSTYINDLLGYYNGIPVLRHNDIGDNDGYAIHKTKDGQLAPCIRGIYLPLTSTPAVGSYQNPKFDWDVAA